MITGRLCVFSSGGCRFIHEARSVLSSLRGSKRPFVDTTSLHGHHSPTTPSSISYTSRGVPWQLMNKANSGVMSPFRNAFSKLFDGLSLSLSFSLSPSLHVSAPAQVTKPRRASLTMGYQNALPFGMSAMVEKFVNLRAALLRIAISDFADIAK